MQWRYTNWTDLLLLTSFASLMSHPFRDYSWNYKSGSIFVFIWICILFRWILWYCTSCWLMCAAFVKMNSQCNFHFLFASQSNTYKLEKKSSFKLWRWWKMWRRPMHDFIKLNIVILKDRILNTTFAWRTIFVSSTFSYSTIGIFFIFLSWINIIRFSSS